MEAAAMAIVLTPPSALSRSAVFLGRPSAFAFPSNLAFSTKASKDVARFPVAAKVVELLIQSILKDNSVELTEEGIGLAKMALETNDLWDENDPWAR
ncbi:hypothetical protein ACSQ67_025139 [Phaseolus vulgaris]